MKRCSSMTNIIIPDNRVEGSRMAPPLPLHRTYGSRIRRYINCKLISNLAEVVCKGVNQSRVNRDIPLAF